MKVRTYDILNAGPRNRFLANGRIVSNSGAAWQPHNMVRDTIANPDEVEITTGINPKKDHERFERACEIALSTAVNIGRSGDRDLIEAAYTMTRYDAQNNRGGFAVYW